MISPRRGPRAWTPHSSRDRWNTALGNGPISQRNRTGTSSRTISAIWPHAFSASGSVNFRLRNVLLLTLTQATSSTAVTVVAAVGSLAGYALENNKAFATLPSTMSVIGTALSPIPASLLMKRVGRRVGFVVGALCATIGGLISVAALAYAHFWLLTVAALFLGVSVA